MEEINPCAVANAFSSLVTEQYPDLLPTRPTSIEKELADELLVKFLDLLSEKTIVTSEVCEIIELNEESQQSSETNTSFGSPDAQSSSQESYVDDDGKEVERDVQEVSLERKRAILNIIDQHPTWSLSTLQKNGAAELKYMYYKQIWGKQVANGGTKFEKFAEISAHVHKMFLEAREEFKSVHDSDLKLWAMQKARSFHDSTFEFKASHFWLQSFKSKHRITSRKITKLVNKRQITTDSEIEKRVQKFRDTFKEKSTFYTPDTIVNTDQVGFNYELVGQRTLSHKGEKITYGFARSAKNLATHSYTVQYVISASGLIVGDVFVCLREQSGRLGPQVSDNLPTLPNITLTCSKSGKLTTSLVEYFMDKVLMKAMTEDFLLVLDCWKGQTDPSLYEDRISDSGACVATLFVPERTTSVCQPLDTTFNRQLKYFARRISSHASLNFDESGHRDDDITSRRCILMMQSLIHRQLSAPIFTPMIKYCWVSSGLIDESINFLSVQQACFTFAASESTVCTSTDCDQTVFIKCAHCRQNLCYACFFFNYHYFCT